MMFDTDSRILNRKLNVSNLNCVQLDLPICLKFRRTIKVLLFPNFQRSFGITAIPFLLSLFAHYFQDCKGRCLFISTKFFFDFLFKIFRNIRLKINLFCEELIVFLGRTAKVSDQCLPANFFVKFCSHLPHSVFHNSES